MCYILLEKFAQVNWDHRMKGKGWQSHSKERCMGIHRTELAYVLCVVGVQ